MQVPPLRRRRFGRDDGRVVAALRGWSGMTLVATSRPAFPVLVDGLQLFAGLEADGFAGRNVDLCAGARVTADAGFARADVEDAESAEFDAIALGESLFHALKDDFHCALSLSLGDASPCDDFVDDVELDHAAAPIGAEICQDGSRPKTLQNKTIRRIVENASAHCQS